MNTEVIVAIVTGVCTIAAVVVSAILSKNGMLLELRRHSDIQDAKLEKAQVVTDTKLEELTREVRAHNNFAQRIPVIEEKIAAANRRIKDLEAKNG